MRRTQGRHARGRTGGETPSPPEPTTSGSSDPDARPRLRPLAVPPEMVPPQAAIAWPALDEQVAVRAVMTYNNVVDPRSDAPWHDRPVDALAPAAFARTVAMAQDEALTVSTPSDEASLAAADRAGTHLDEAEAAMERADGVLDEVVDYPPEATSTARQALAEYEADRQLAARRGGAGDSRHERRPVQRYHIRTASGLLAGLDVALLWRPLLGLGALADSWSLYKWLLAIVFAGLQALFIDLAVHHYREAERDATERRDRVVDHNRTAVTALSRGDLATLAIPAPPEQEQQVAVDRLRTGYRWLLVAAGGVGVVAVVRVAFLSRAAGQSVEEAVLFGSVVGLVLGGVVLLLGRLACAGNRLGDRLRAGAEMAVEVDERRAEHREDVVEARGDARRELVVAERLRARAGDLREWVVGQYWQALLLATSWLGLGRPPVEHSDLIVPRELEVADAAQERMTAVRDRLGAVDRWLGAEQPVRSVLAVTVGAGGPASADEAGTRRTARTTVRLTRPPRPGEPGGLVPVEVPVVAAPHEPRWLLAVGCAAVVVVAVLAALVAPTQDGASAAVSVGGITIGAN